MCGQVCCEPGKGIRTAMRRLLELPRNESVQVLHVARAAYARKGSLTLLD